MDAALFLLVDRGTEVPATEVRRKSWTWDGTVHEEQEVTYVFGTSQMKPCPISSWVLARLPQRLRSAELDSYIVDDETLTLLESEVNGLEVSARSHLPEWLLHIISRSSNWVVAFLWHWDEMEEVEVGTAVAAIQKLQAVLKWNGNRHGFCVYSDITDPKQKNPHPA